MSKTIDSETGRNFDFSVSVEAEAGAGGFKAGALSLSAHRVTFQRLSPVRP